MDQHILSYIIFTPLLALLFLLLVPTKLEKAPRWIALIAVGIQLILAIFAWQTFDRESSALTGGLSESAYQFLEKVNWIHLDLGSLGKLSIDYFLGVDGISMPMVLLSGLVLFIGVIASWNIQNKNKGYFALYLLLSSAIMGCFMALDFFLFYLFFEFMLLPMYFLIGMWGGPRREYASIKFFLYTLAGSIFILIVMIALYLSVYDPIQTGVNAGVFDTHLNPTTEQVEHVRNLVNAEEINPENIVHTFNMVQMVDAKNYLPGSILSIDSNFELFKLPARFVGFLFLFIGFAIKLPMVPFHTWLPDAHVEAPTPISVVLAGILLKIGAYGLIRTAFSMFPDGAIHFAWWIGLLGVISIIYGAFNALAMKDLKKMIAYSSVSHMGFVLLGLASLTSEGVSGAVYQMFSHGILSAALFLIAGVLHSQTNNRMIENYRGLAQKMPMFTVITVIFFFASLGLPGFSGFIGELFVLLGAFASEAVNNLIPRWMSIVAMLGLLLGAAYFLWTLQRMYFGSFWTAREINSNLVDLNIREKLLFYPLIVLTLVLGIFPNLLLDVTNGTVGHFVDFVLTNGREQLDFIQNIKK